jgi:rfaE bifunctional protein kinase chain/domain
MSQRTVFVSGTFNVLHPGHLRLFRFAKECGGKLIVGVNSDSIAGTNALVPEHLRLEGVQSNNLVDEAFLIIKPMDEVISGLRPDIVVKGREHEFRLNLELTELKKYGGQLIFSSGEAKFSSFDLLREEFFELDLSSVKMPVDYMFRHHITATRLEELLHKFGAMKVCVVGDLIVDEYITCEPLGMSQEDPTIVVTPVDSIKFVGGAGIVAAHGAGLGAQVNFFSVAGDDAHADFAQKKLSAYGVQARVLKDENRPTTLKQRFRSKGKTLLRVSYLQQGTIPKQLQDQLLEEVQKVVRGASVLVFSDFNYGCLPQAVVNKITLMAKAEGIVLVADSQSSSQMGDISRFRNMDLLTPTEHEARMSTRNREAGLVMLAKELREQASAENILLKLGEEGLLIHAKTDGDQGWVTDRIRVLNSAPKDVAGAGDSLLIAAALTIAAGGNIWEAACIGSLAAAVQVGRVGNTPIHTKELLQELT